jgi:hypothetical protein
MNAMFKVEKMIQRTKIDRWFLVQIREIEGVAAELAGAGN